MLRLVPTPIGNLGDISIRALQVIGAAEVLLCEDTRISKKLLSLLEDKGYFKLLNIEIKDKEYISLHSHNEDLFLDSITPSFFDKDVIYISDAGMPSISDPGAKIVRYMIDHNLAFEMLPGANAALVAFASSGLIDGFGVAIKEFVFYGFLSIKHKLKELSNIINMPYPVIIYESPKRILDTLCMINTLAPSIEISAQKELTKLHEARYYGTADEILSQLESKNINGEWVLIIINKEQKLEPTLSKIDIMTSDIPPKFKAKLLNKIENIGVSAWYERLISKEDK